MGSKTRGEPLGVRADTSGCVDRRPHSAPLTPLLLTAAAVLMEALSPLRCAALVLLCLTTLTLLAPPSCCNCCEKDKYTYKTTLPPRLVWYSISFIPWARSSPDSVLK